MEVNHSDNGTPVVTNGILELHEPSLLSLETVLIPSPSNPTEPYNPKEVIERVFPTLSLISLASILGLLTRLGLTYIFTVPNQKEAIFPLVYSQVVGCFLIGIFLESKSWLVNRHASLYSALASGLCGSITTFSSWNLGIFQQLSGLKEFPYLEPNPRQAIFNSITIFFITLIMSLACLSLGRSFGKYLKTCSWTRNVSPVVLKQQSLIPRFSRVGPFQCHFNRNNLSELFMFMLFGIGPIVLLIPGGLLLDWGQLALSCGFAPLGAYLRYVLSRLNPKTSFMPLGTFTANIVGSMVLGFVNYIILTNHDYFGINGCRLMNGIGDGFCGCLTTVSTFMVELQGSKSFSHKTIYLFISVLASQLAFLLFLWIPTYVFSNTHPDLFRAPSTCF